jgi:transposase
MEYYAGIDVSLECSSVCVVDASGKIIRESKVASEPDALISWLKSLGYELSRIGLEAGPLSQWLFAAMRGWPSNCGRHGTCARRSRRCR